MYDTMKMQPNTDEEYWTLEGEGMGCDIHLYVEQRQANGAWRCLKVTNPRIAQYREWAALARTDGYAEQAAELENVAATMESKDSAEGKNWIWHGRNYDLFAMLANVRNRYETEGFVPVVPPRGLPKDASTDVLQASCDLENDGHSHSYLTVQDLTAYDWEQKTIKCGMVDEHEYAVFLSEGCPSNWCASVAGGDTFHVLPSTMDALLQGTFARDPDKTYYTRVEWMATHRDLAGDFYTKSLPQLVELAGTDPTSVRLVFFFDG